MGIEQNTPLSIAIPRETAFNLESQFSADAVKAINASATAVKAIHAATHAGGKFLPDANDSPDSDDDNSTAAHIKRCKNHLEQCDEEACERAPSDGSLDHMALAHRHLTEALEQRARAGRRAAVGGQPHVGVRFA
jgi:hypothetical protein